MSGAAPADWLRRTLIAMPFVWLGLFFLLPFAIVVAISVSEAVDARPPFLPPLRREVDGWTWAVSLESYRLLLNDSLYGAALLNAARIAATATVICLLIGYPMAYAIARTPRRYRAPLLLAVVLPFWTSFLLRVYAWMVLLRPTGLINEWLAAIGLIDEPLVLMNNEFAVHLGIVYSYLPFMVLPLYASLERIDGALYDAAADLGSRGLSTFWRIALPLSLPGAAAGALLVFVPAAGEFVIPELLGGPDTPMIGRVLWSEFFANRDWPTAAAVAVATLAILVLPILLFQRRSPGTGR